MVESIFQSSRFRLHSCDIFFTQFRLLVSLCPTIQRLHSQQGKSQTQESPKLMVCTHISPLEQFGHVFICMSTIFF